MTITIPLSAIVFCMIGFSAILGAVAMNAAKDAMVDWLFIIVIVFIIALMCIGAYLCR